MSEAPDRLRAMPGADELPDDDFEFADYCARPMCRKEFRQSAGRGRRRDYCSETCRRLADRDYKRAKALVEHFERLALDVPPEPVAGAGGALATMAERFRLAVICDTGYSPGGVLRELLDHQRMLETFSYLFFSNEHGMSKPDVRVFRHTLAQLDVHAGEAAHVGDIQRTDIAGAQAAGMTAVHFVGANDRDVARSTADLIVRHFDELPAALGGLVCPGC